MIVLLHVLVYISNALRQFHMHLVIVRAVSIKVYG